MHKLLKTSIIIMVLIGIFVWKVSNFTGYCKETGRVLTEEELIRRAVRKDIYEENPYCCSIAKGGWLISDTEEFFNNLFGFYNYQLSIYTKRKPPITYDFKDPYYEEHGNIDECGRSFHFNGITMSEKDYQININAIKNSRRKESHEIHHN